MKRIYLIMFIIVSCWLIVSSADAAVDVYLSPIKDVPIVGGRVTYTITLKADEDTKLETIGDIFLAYEKDFLTLVTENVQDLATDTKWTAQILDLDYENEKMVSDNYAMVRYAKVSLLDTKFLTANVPVEVLVLPFKINPNNKNRMTRLYFPKALAVNHKHKNVLRNAAESFLIKKSAPAKRRGRRGQ